MTTKLRAIQEALDAQRALDLDGLDPATRASAEELARVDAWLRARPEPTLDDPEAFAARIEAHLGTVVADDFDPLATPDFSDFGDASDFGDVESDEARVVSIAAARSVAKGTPSSGASSAVMSVAAPSAAPAAASPASASASRATGGMSSSGGSPAPRARGWWFASAAVVLLAASGTFVAFRSASSPESLASPAASSAYDMSATAESTSAPGAPTAEPAAAPLADDGLEEEASTRDLAFARERSEGRQNRAGGAVGGAVTGALDGPTEQAARARPRPSTTMSAAPSMASAEGFSGGQRRGLDPWASEVTEAAPAAPPTAASPRMTTSTVDEASGENEESLVRIERWRSRVLSCVPTSVRTLTTRVESRNGRVSAVLDTSPTLDSTARGCVETALRGAPLDRPSATLRWKREL